jgi:glycosyltransferase involved in cell wall biosynthesis
MAIDGTLAINAAIIGQRPTGLGFYALHLISGLAALGERLVVYTSRPDLIKAPGAQVHRVSAAMGPERGAPGHLRRLLWVQTGLRAGVWRTHPRVLLNVTPEGLLGTALPQVTTIHDVLPLLYPAEYPRQQYYFRYYVPAVLRASCAVIASSESTRRDLLRFYNVPPEKVHVVLLGHDPCQFTAEGPTAVLGPEPYLLYVGNVMPHKNLDRLVEAFANVVSQMPVRLVLCGSGRRRHMKALRRRIAALSLEDQIDWRPYASDEELPALYRGAHALVLPSLHEGFGLPALEAMACGTPVVAAATSSIPEVVGDAALLVDPRDVGSITTALGQVLTDDPLCKDLSARGRARARCFPWEATARAVQRTVAHAIAA